MPRAMWWFQGGGRFFVSEVPLYYFENGLSCEGAKQRDARQARGEEEPQEDVQGYLAH